METKNGGAGLLASEVQIDMQCVGGRTYIEASARGWNTGPCSSASIALARICAYFAGEEISEAAPMMASRAEMDAAQELFRGRLHIRGMNYCADPGELHSDAWIRASRQIEETRAYLEPEMVAASEKSARIKLGGAS